MRRCTGFPDDHGEKQLRRRFVRIFTGFPDDHGEKQLRRRFVRSFTRFTNDGPGACERRFYAQFHQVHKRRRWCVWTTICLQFHRVHRRRRWCVWTTIYAQLHGAPSRNAVGVRFACSPLVTRQFNRPSTEGVYHVYSGGYATSIGGCSTQSCVCPLNMDMCAVTRACARQSRVCLLVVNVQDALCAVAHGSQICAQVHGAPRRKG